MQQLNNFINQISPQKLKKLKLNQPQDLLHYYPREHIHYPRRQISKIKNNTHVSIIGIVTLHQITIPKNKPNLTLQKWTIKDKTGKIDCIQFYKSTYYQSTTWQKEQNKLYSYGVVVVATGKAKKNTYNNRIELTNPNFTIIEPSIACSFKSSITPIYPLTKEIKNSDIQEWINYVINSYQVKDPLPSIIKNKYSLISLSEAFKGIHQPQSIEQLELARKRLVFDEFFYITLSMHKRRTLIQSQTSPQLEINKNLIKQFLRSLPFKLTKAQKRVSSEILQDLQQPIPTNRLIQGDVGSGKTVIAFIAALSAVETGYQVALMAPTEVLSAQLAQKIAQWAEPLNIRVALLTSSTNSREKKDIYENLENGTLSIIVGTHALFQEKVQFLHLGLVVINEQHRFGVEARHQLVAKGKQPHVLTMTATPIPRSLALTIYGDLDISYLDELPSGRLPIKTYTLTEKSRRKAYNLIRKEIDKGHQAYIILSLIEQSNNLEFKAAITETEYLSQNIFPQENVGLLHGQQSSQEKESAITQFKEGKISILVSTTVVEVGVDCPNATVILIEDAQRFGLAQLHQLRGRVGRGSAQSYCLLMNSSSSKNAKERLKIVQSSNDGFWLAEMDLAMRGQGQLLGTQQHGIPAFSLADLRKDREIHEAAYEAVKLITKTDPTLTGWPALQKERDKRYPLIKTTQMN